MQVHGGCALLVLMLLPGRICVGILCRVYWHFWGSLHWLVGAVDMGHFGITFLEALILFEQWAGHRLLSEKGYQASHSGVEIRQEC